MLRYKNNCPPCLSVSQKMSILYNMLTTSHPHDRAHGTQPPTPMHQVHGVGRTQTLAEISCGNHVALTKQLRKVERLQCSRYKNNCLLPAWQYPPVRVYCIFRFHKNSKFKTPMKYLGTLNFATKQYDDLFLYPSRDGSCCFFRPTLTLGTS